MQIWKFTMAPGTRTVDLPEGAQVLHVHEQRGEVCLWAMVDPQSMIESRTFLVTGTGHDFSGVDKTDYIGSVHLEGGSLVFHVFEVG